MPELFSSELEDLANDQDITLQGTPLYEYLQELDLIEPVEEEHFPKKTSVSIERGFWHGTSVVDYVKLQIENLRCAVSHIFPLSQDVLVGMSRRYYSKYGQEIMHSKVILEDDLDYLCIQTPQQFLNAMNNNNKITGEIPSTSKRYSAMMIATIAFLISFFFFALPTVPQLCLAFPALFVVGFNIRLEIIMEMWKRKHESNLRSLNRFLCVSAQLHSQVKRSIRLIQEVEVVSRGFKLVNGATPISRIEQVDPKSTRMFMKLRQNIIHTVLQCTLACRSATLDLLEYSLEDSESLEEHFLCKVALCDLGVPQCLLQSSTLSEKFVATDGYSLRTMKYLNELLCKQRSEMLTRLSLTLSGTTWDFNLEGFLSKFKEILSGPNVVTLDCLQSLKCCHDMHKYVTNAESTTKIPENRAGKTSVLRINLHSLQVHMRTAMHAAMHLEEILPDDDKKFELPENFINVKRHLESGLDCWEQFNKELSTFQEIERSDEKKEHPVQPSTTREEEPVVHDIMDEEIPLEDQIFEGVADDSDDQCINDDDSFDLRPRKLVEDTATVMQELRSVLAVKTSEKEREMWKMKLFPGYKGKRVGNEKKAAENGRESEEKCEKMVGENEIGSKTAEGKPVFENEKESDIENERKKVEENSIEPEVYGKVLNHTNTEIHENVRIVGKNTNLCGDVSHKERANGLPAPVSQLLTFPKKSFPGGRRPPSGKNRCTPFHDVTTHSLTSQPEDNNDKPDWSVGLGIGFSNSLALQAAAMARKQKNSGFTEITSIGSDSDSS